MVETAIPIFTEISRNRQTWEPGYVGVYSQERLWVRRVANVAARVRYISNFSAALSQLSYRSCGCIQPAPNTCRIFHTRRKLPMRITIASTPLYLLVYSPVPRTRFPVDHGLGTVPCWGPGSGWVQLTSRLAFALPTFSANASPNRAIWSLLLTALCGNGG